MSESKAGKIEYRTDRHAIVHLPIGKANFDEPALLENYAALIDEINRAKPASAKGRYIHTITITTSMGPGRAGGPGGTWCHGGRRRCSLSRTTFLAPDHRRHVRKTGAGEAEAVIFEPACERAFSYRDRDRGNQ